MESDLSNGAGVTPGPVGDEARKAAGRIVVTVGQLNRLVSRARQMGLTVDFGLTHDSPASMVSAVVYRREEGDRWPA